LYTGVKGAMILKRISVWILLLLVLVTCAACNSSKNMYENKGKHFRVTFPDGWKVEKGNPREGIVKAVSQTDPTEIIIGAVPVSKQSKEYNTDELAKIMLTKGQRTPNGMKVAESGETTIAGHKAIWFLQSVANTPQIEYLLIYEVLGNTHIYQIGMFGPKDTYANNRELFDGVLASFTMLP